MGERSYCDLKPTIVRGGAVLGLFKIHLLAAGGGEQIEPAESLNLRDGECWLT